VRPGVKDVWRLGNLLRSCKGTPGDFPRLIPNIHCTVPPIDRQQSTMMLGEWLLRGGMGISQQLSERQHVSVFKLRNQEDRFRVRHRSARTSDCPCGFVDKD